MKVLTNYQLSSTTAMRFISKRIDSAKGPAAHALAAIQRRRQRRSLAKARKAQAKQLTAQRTEQKRELKAQRMSLFFTIPAELRNRIYELVFTRNDDDFYISTDTSQLRLLLTCKQFYAEAHELAYTRVWHELSTCARLAERHDQLQASTRKLIKHLCLQINTTYLKLPPLRIWDLSSYAISMPLLAITSLYIRTLYFRRRSWNRPEHPWKRGDRSVERQILGCVRAWPTLKDMRIEVAGERKFPSLTMNDDALVVGLRDEIENRGNEAYKIAESPAAVFDSGWGNWLAEWDAGFITPGFSDPHTTLGGIRMVGKAKTEAQGRCVLIVCKLLRFSDHAGR